MRPNNHRIESDPRNRRGFLKRLARIGGTAIGGSLLLSAAGASTISNLVGIRENVAYAASSTFQGQRFGWETGLDGQIHHYVEFDVFACFPNNAQFSITGPFNCTAYPTSKPLCGSKPLDSYGVDTNGHVRAGIRYYDWAPLPPASFAQNWTLTITT